MENQESEGDYLACFFMNKQLGILEDIDNNHILLSKLIEFIALTFSWYSVRNTMLYKEYPTKRTSLRGNVLIK